MRIGLYLLTIFSLFPLQVYAHSIFLNCFQVDAKVNCTASFSDGSSAENIPFEVISYEDSPLLSGKTEDDSNFSFVVPDTDYYILLDAGPGHVVEVDMLDIGEE